MKKIMKKNQVIITSLAILIAVAGYLNFADVDLGFQDKETSADSSSILDEVSYDLTDETALMDENELSDETDVTDETETEDTSTPGEAVLTGLPTLPLRRSSAENRYAHKTNLICRKLSIMKVFQMTRNRKPSIQWWL